MQLVKVKNFLTISYDGSCKRVMVLPIYATQPTKLAVSLVSVVSMA